MTRFRIVPERSRVWIDASSSVHPIHSETNGLEGWFEAELGERGQIEGHAGPHGHLALAVGRLTSGNPLLDREMKRRIDARRYPTITGDEPWLRQVQRVLLSSEPYRFDTSHIAQAQALCPRAQVQLVDGELLSWYGPRAAQGLRELRRLAAE